LAIRACKEGQGACTALNASNEIAVDAFLNNQIKFTDIFKINETSVNKFVSERVANIDEVLLLDKIARVHAQMIVDNMMDEQHQNEDKVM
jgi:1-deoxy-D-xylulose-5-phosphate reductoisomerase